MWIYQVSTGLLTRDGELMAHGYSGQPGAKNDPSREREPNVGPIPRGRYTIGAPRDSERTGPVSIPLYPHPANQMYGRGEFMIHGDSIKAPGTASHGCVILPRPIRLMIADSPDREMEVV